VPMSSVELELEAQKHVNKAAHRHTILTVSS
jgi:hypothetical protein